MGSYSRRTAELDDAITAAYVQDVPTRDIGRVAEALTGKNVSRSTLGADRLAGLIADAVRSDFRLGDGSSWEPTGFFIGGS